MCEDGKFNMRILSCRFARFYRVRNCSQANPKLLDIQFGRDVDFVGNIFAVLFALPDTFGQQIFNLSVHGTKVILRPGSNGMIQFFGKPERNLFFTGISHIKYSLSVQAAGIYDRLSIVIAAENNEQIGYHCRLAFFVQLHDSILV